MRGHVADYTNKEYVLGGTYETMIADDGIFKVSMKLTVKLQKPSDFGIYKCIAKNALGSSEEIIKVLRKSISRIRNEKAIKIALALRWFQKISA